MTALLDSITISNFRSIRGTITVPLDAPIVLVHGQNGAGKTSLLSAIELGLTGSVASLERADAQYKSHLVHKDANESLIKVKTKNLTKNEGDIRVSGGSITGKSLLRADEARFFTERSFLAQSTLGRLLELYEDKDARKGDSPLTRFVKSLLGLDQLDALIEGLHDAGNVRRLRTTVPNYWELREILPTLEADLGAQKARLATCASEISNKKIQLRVPLEFIGLNVDLIDSMPNLKAELDVRPEDSALQNCADWKRELTALTAQWHTSGGVAATGSHNALEAAAAAANHSLEDWRSNSEPALLTILGEVAASYPSLPHPNSSGYEVVHKAASEQVERELLRLQRLLTTDLTDTQTLSDLGMTIESARARIAALDGQIVAQAAGASSLAQALSGIMPHVHGDSCPVCTRNFAEFSKVPLQAFVSNQIAALTESAGQLQARSLERSNSQTELTKAERERDTIQARRLSDVARNETRRRESTFTNLRQRLAATFETAKVGQQLLHQAASTARTLTDARGRDQIATSVRARVGEIATVFNVQPLAETESVEAGLHRFTQHLADLELKWQRQQNARVLAVTLCGEMIALNAEFSRLQDEIRNRQENLLRLDNGKRFADKQIADAKELARIAGEARTDIVRKVFNQSLNSIWKDLFVRLAPDEPFIPRFALPQNQTGPVEAVLETLYRSGGKGGNPRAMLSAGNLNTAALTLFLALHLSAAPMLPWLIIDDPVQSMDEVHIAQFAALLRTLSKQHNRQVIIAVHEKPLFDYLALELAPAFLSDKLITIDLERGPDGATILDYRPTVWIPDKAFAA